ncbi:hypothetical protein CEXT_64411 [Caerostris extrusa]|uniref:Uncharacterized protein n=1 Tax=Caerostris extrusa TaxID=172846 RepID=A0AAV4PQA9_CAEEX|nr:hypothetical protein CEXT_64411 [Caerostris extrusa]
MYREEKPYTEQKERLPTLFIALCFWPQPSVCMPFPDVQLKYPQLPEPSCALNSPPWPSTARNDQLLARAVLLRKIEQDCQPRQLEKGVKCLPVKPGFKGYTLKNTLSGWPGINSCQKIQ